MEITPQQEHQDVHIKRRQPLIALVVIPLLMDLATTIAQIKVSLSQEHQDVFPIQVLVKLSKHKILPFHS